MSLKEQIYSVLIVSASDSFNAALTDILPEAKYYPIIKASSASEANRARAERAFDLILINSPLPDDSGVHLAIDACCMSTSAVLLIVRSDIHDEVYDKVSPYGVFTLPKPIAKASMIQALRWMVSARARLSKSEKKTLTLEEKMEEIRLVNRAKLLLISKLNMSEPDAHHFLQQQAMNKCISRKEVAENIILTYS